MRLIDKIDKRHLMIALSVVFIYKQVAGQAIFEIGRRLKHVKENDLVHGEWENWCIETIEITPAYANRYIKVFDEFKNTNQYTSIGLNKLYQIATLPEGSNQMRHFDASKTTKGIGDLIGEDVRSTQRIMKLNDLIPELQKLVSEGKLGTTAGEQLAHMTEEVF